MSTLTMKLRLQNWQPWTPHAENQQANSGVTLMFEVIDDFQVK